jgi:ABC-type sugar transport system ATPase subunit
MGVEIVGLSKRFASAPPVLIDLDLTVPGDLVVILGASGTGKTTLLRCVAGLERPDAGTIRIDGEDVTRWPPQDRDVALVTQEGALMPNRTVEGNMRFPLQIRGLHDEEQRRRVRVAARLLGLEDMLPRQPHELAAGQARTVATARQLTRAPRAFLFDEPLANTDAAQRRRIRREVQVLQRGFEIPMLYATNDPEDAFVLADRVAVLDGGRFVQVAVPAEIHARPATLAVAQLAGVTPFNLLGARPAGSAHLDVAGVGAVRVSPPLPPTRLLIGFRAEAATTSPSADAFPIAATVEAVADLGAEVVVNARTDDGDEIVAHLRRPAGTGLVPGERTAIHVSREDTHVFDAATGAAVRHGLAP